MKNDTPEARKLYLAAQKMDINITREYIGRMLTSQYAEDLPLEAYEKLKTIMKDTLDIRDMLSKEIHAIKSTPCIECGADEVPIIHNNQFKQPMCRACLLTSEEILNRFG